MQIVQMFQFSFLNFHLGFDFDIEREPIVYKHDIREYERDREIGIERERS